MPSLRRRPSTVPTKASPSTIRRTEAHLRRPFSAIRRHIRWLRSHRRGNEENAEESRGLQSEQFPRYSPSADTESLHIGLRRPSHPTLLSPSLASVGKRPGPSSLAAPLSINGQAAIIHPGVTMPPIGTGIPAAASAPQITSVQATFTGPNVTLLKSRPFCNESTIEKKLDIVDSRGQPLPVHELHPALLGPAFLHQRSTAPCPTRIRVPRRAHRVSGAEQREQQAQQQQRLQARQELVLPDLPDEIWSQIGKITIDRLGLVDVTKAQIDARTLQRRVQQPPIAQTCRYLRKELLPYFYRNTLLLKTSVSCQDVAKRWLVAIGPGNRRHLDNIFFVADRASHLLDPSTGATHRCGKVKIMLGLTQAECRVLGLIACYSAVLPRVYARKIKWLEGTNDTTEIDGRISEDLT